MNVIRLLFSFKGRISISQYWLGTLGVSALNVISLITLVMSWGASAHAKGEPSAALATSLGANALIMLLNGLGVWCGWALQVKRFHDRGRSGWFTLLPMIPIGWIICTIIGSAIANAPYEQMFRDLALPFGVLLLTGLAFFIDLGCLPGKPWPNRYGDPPNGTPGAPPSDGSAPRPQPAAPSDGLTTAAATSLRGAEAAMARAISEQDKAYPVQAAVARVQHERPTPRAPASIAAASAAPSFGRRAR